MRALLGFLLATMLVVQDTHCPAYPSAARQADEDRLVRDAEFFRYQSLPGMKRLVAVPPSRNFIDDAVFGKMQQDAVEAAPLTNDSEFIRRVYLDLTGRIPTFTRSGRSWLTTAPTNVTG